MAQLPLLQRREGLSVPGAVSYPSGSPVGAALQGFGNAVQGASQRLSALAEVADRKRQQEEAFDAKVIESEFLADLSRTEDDTIRNAPANAAGIHDSVYGELDPDTDEPMKPGAFDELFGRYAERMPETQRADFEAKKRVYRLQGSDRLAAAQYKGRQQYELSEVGKTQEGIVNAILQSPADEGVDAFIQGGEDLIRKSGLNALDKETALYNLRQNAAKARAQAMLQRDPDAAANMRTLLGLEKPAPAPAAGGGSSFNSVAPRLVSDLARDFGLTAEQAAGIVGQLGHESAGFGTLQEVKPLVPGSRGGFGFAQWTGPRRKQFEAYARMNNMEPTSYEANYGFLAYELKNTPEGAVLDQVRLARDAKAAGRIFTDKFLRPGIPGYASRDKWTERALAAAGGTVSGASGPDPRFADLSPSDRLTLANQADVLLNERDRQSKAQASADYTGYKDAFELNILQGGVMDEALIVNDPVLQDGDKSTLLRSFRTQNEGMMQIQADVSALASGGLSLDPYASKDKTRVDNLYSSATKGLSQDQSGALAGTIIQQTGVVPQAVLNEIRKGLSSSDPAAVVSAAQTAVRIGQLDPAALARRDGGTEAQKIADDFAFYVNRLNLDPTEAGRRIIEANKPEAQFQRKALEPAAKEFKKSIGDTEIGALFDESFAGWQSDPELGFTEGQALGIKAEFAAIAEDQFYATNGNAELARNRAVEELKRLYGVTGMTGKSVIIRHPPERYWPAIEGASDPYGYIKEQIIQDFGALVDVSDVTGFFPTQEAKDAALSEVRKARLFENLEIVSTPQTDAMIKAGQLPAYGVLYKDRNGNYQTVPGKLFQPDLSKVSQMRQERIDAARALQEQNLREAQRKPLVQFGTPSGDAVVGSGNAPIQLDPITVTPSDNPTVQDQVDQSRKELFDRAPEALKP